MEKLDTQENLDLGVHSKKYETLVKHEFDLTDIEKHMGDWKKSDKESVIAKKKVVNKTLSSNVTYIEGAEKVSVKGGELELYTIKKFLTKKECDGLVS